MQKISSHLRIQRIYQMIFELAGGNFNKEILPGDTDDELQSLGLLVGMVAEEMRRPAYPAGPLSHGLQSKYLLQTTIILDASFAIESFNSELTQLLGFNAEVLIGRDFATLLARDSFDSWSEIKDRLLTDSNCHITVQLCYKAKGNSQIPAFCTIRDSCILQRLS